MGDGELFLIVAQLAPPLIIGEDPDEVMAQARRLPFVPVKVLGRFGMTPDRARQLVELLERQLKVLDAQAEQKGKST